MMQEQPAGALRVAKLAPVLPVCGALLLALQLGACGAGHVASAPQRRTVAASAPTLPRPAASQAIVPFLPNGNINASIWHLRAGLNVAALSCRSLSPVAPAYGRVLTRHRALLAAAYQAEQRRLGVAGFDREQTRVYNRFALQRSPQEFCRSAAAMAARAAAMDSPALASASPRMASELQGYLR